MEVLTAGGYGFIGTNLVKYLAGMNCRIRIVDNFFVGNERNLKKLQDQDSHLSDMDMVVFDI